MENQKDKRSDAISAAATSKEPNRFLSSDETQPIEKPKAPLGSPAPAVTTAQPTPTDDVATRIADGM
jgi:hypothetical protein